MNFLIITVTLLTVMSSCLAAPQRYKIPSFVRDQSRHSSDTKSRHSSDTKRRAEGTYLSSVVSSQKSRSLSSSVRRNARENFETSGSFYSPPTTSPVPAYGNPAASSLEVDEPARSYNSPKETCADDEVLNLAGTCVKPIINRQIFVYSAPPQKITIGPPPNLPTPKVNYNIVFVRTPEYIGGTKPIVVPPPQQKTFVYVLNKKPSAIEQELIEFPTIPTEPEVYFVNYDKDDNPELPGGISLRDALSQSAQTGEIISTDASSPGGDTIGEYGGGGSLENGGYNTPDGGAYDSVGGDFGGVNKQNEGPVRVNYSPPQTPVNFYSNP